MITVTVWPDILHCMNLCTQGHQFPLSHPAWPHPSNSPEVPVSADAPLGVRAAVLVHVHLRAHVEHDAADLGVGHRPEAHRVEGRPGDAETADVDAVGGAALVRVALRDC